MSTTDTRPTWSHTNNLTKPNTLYVAPSFKDELGAVFIGVGDNSPSIDRDGWSGDHKGTWLTRQEAEQFCAAVMANVAWSEQHNDWCADDCACQQ